MTGVDARVVLSLGWFAATALTSTLVLGLPIGLYSLKLRDGWAKEIGFRLFIVQLTLFLLTSAVVGTYIYRRHITNFEIPQTMQISRSLR